MKQLFIIIVSLFTTTTLAIAQDTIFLNSGKSLVVEIISESPESVKYKLWSNLKGPDWVEKQSNINRIKRAHTLPTVPSALDFSNCNANNNNKKTKDKRKPKCPSGNRIVAHIDSLYFFNVTSARNDIQQYVTSLPTCINRKCIYEFYHDRFEASRSSGVPEYIVRDGEVYLFLYKGEDYVDVASVVSRMYARQDKEEKVNYWIEQLKQYSAENDNLLDDDVAALEKETQELLHPKRKEDLAKGVWVRLMMERDWGGLLHWNKLKIMRIDYFDPPTDGIKMGGEPPKKRYLHSPSACVNGSDVLFGAEVNTSQGVDFQPTSGVITTMFASKKVKDLTWLNGTANILIDGSQQLAAGLKSTLITSKGVSVGQKLGYSILIDAGTSIVSHLLGEMTHSRTEQRIWNYIMMQTSDDIMSANETYTYAWCDNDGRQHSSGYDSKPVFFVRWAPEDSIIFVDVEKGIPVTLEPVEASNPLLKEYYAAKKEYTFWQPKYAIPVFGSFALMSVGLGVGIDLIVKSNTNAKLIGGIILLVATPSVMTIPIVVSESKRLSKIKNVYKNINDRSYEKLKQKYEAQISLGPGYTPENNGCGIAVNLNF